MGVVAKRFGVYLVSLDPAVGSEMRKTRPCVVISPSAMHEYLRTVVIVPMTSRRTGWPTRVPSDFHGHPGELALDQIRSVDRGRIGKQIGELDRATIKVLTDGLQSFFS